MADTQDARSWGLFRGRFVCFWACDFGIRQQFGKWPDRMAPRNSGFVPEGTLDADALGVSSSFFGIQIFIPLVFRGNLAESIQIPQPTARVAR